ncbi:MAG: ATP synthase F1 subunit gamma, partial [bacterium]|nr:ATP synthase F1 subunit gamma [bacterium]
ATKMRKAQHVALAARPYAVHALGLLRRVSHKTEFAHWLLEQRSTRRIALILVTSDKGLCGILNHNVLRRLEEFIEERRDIVREGHCDFISVGLYGARHLKRRGYAVIKEFAGIGDYAKLQESSPIADFLLTSWRDSIYDEVFCIYTDFVSTLRQTAVLRQVLPLTKKALEEIAGGVSERIMDHPVSTLLGGSGIEEAKEEGARFFYEYKLEPSPEEVLETLLPALVRVRIHQIILESNASEHSARMLAMKNASDNAKELLEELHLSFNKARQASITREIAEITSGAAALETV